MAHRQRGTTTPRRRLAVAGGLLALCSAIALTTAGPAAAAAPATAATTTEASANPAVSTLGATVTYSAMVSSPTSGPPTGTVHFTAGGTELCGATVRLTRNATSVATCSTTTTPGGRHRVVAAYSGDPAHARSSGATTVTVKIPTTTSGNADRDVSGPETGSFAYPSATYRAFFETSPGSRVAPTGTLAFTIGSTAVCSTYMLIAQREPDGGWFAGGTCGVRDVPAGTQTITVTYSGDARFDSSSDTFTATFGAPSKGPDVPLVGLPGL